MKRRNFFVKAGIGAASALTALNRKRVFGANERIVLAAIGIGGRNTNLTRGFIKFDHVDYKTLCDCNRVKNNIENVSSLIENTRGKKPLIEQDYRKVLEDPDIDAVIAATPDHWHGPLTIVACQAGKDVFVEKPLSHNIWEGRKMVEAARKYGRIVQCGTQNRSSEYNNQAIDYIQSGKLGSIHYAKVFNMKPGSLFYKKPSSPPPSGVDYDRWLGPALWMDYFDGIINGGWHYFWRFCAGDVGNDGSHQLDLARWLIGRQAPRAVHSTGGNIAFQDAREVPDTSVTTFEFDDDLIMTFELTQWTPYMDKTPSEIRGGDRFPRWKQSATHIELYGTQGMMMLGRHGGGWQVFQQDGEIVAQEYGRFPDFLNPDPHKRNFLDCIKSRKRPNADVEEAHFSTNLVHLACISLRCGNRYLQWNAHEERFVGEHQELANRFIKRQYREPYTLPEKI